MIIFSKKLNGLKRNILSKIGLKSAELYNFALVHQMLKTMQSAEHGGACQ